MRKRWWVIIASVVIAAVAYAVKRGTTPSIAVFPESRVHSLLAAGLGQLQGALSDLDSAMASGDRGRMHAAFRSSRMHYKWHEALVASAAPSMAGILNGPLPEDDDDPNQPIGAPAAFQRIEARIFSNDSMTTAHQAEIRADIASMKKTVRAVQELEPHFPLTQINVLEAFRTELARVSTLALAGMDSQESGDGVIESAHALDGMHAVAEAVLADGARRELWRALADTLNLAARQLRSDNDFVASNRLRFIAHGASAVGRSLARLRVRHAAIDTTLRVVWRARATTLFERDAFDASAYAPAIAMQPTPQLLALGNRLFREKKLSGPGTRSCATCHMPELAFTDGLARQQAIGTLGKSHRRAPARNTPTLLNVGLQPAFFADARVATLEEQIRVVLASPAEMSSSVELAVSRLNADTSYRNAFRDVANGAASSAAPPTAAAPEISEALLQNVLAAYVRSLVRLDSRFDRAVAGDTGALSAEERRGFTVFMGKGRCGTCHFAPLMSGVIPPAFRASETEIIGVPLRADTANAMLDPDVGRSAVDSIPLHRHAFIVPTLRNIARTAPYMHNGVFATLEEVVDFYDRGGGQGIGVSIPAQTLPSTTLKLTADEKRALIAFMRALNDVEFKR